MEQHRSRASDSALKLLLRLGGGIGRRKGLKIPWDIVPCRFDSGPRHHKTNQALMPSKQHGIGAFSSCVRPLKEPPHIFGVKSILQIKLTLSKNIIAIERATLVDSIVPARWSRFGEASDRVAKGRAGGYNKLERLFVPNRVGGAGHKNWKILNERPSY